MTANMKLALIFLCIASTETPIDAWNVMYLTII